MVIQYFEWWILVTPAFTTHNIGCPSIMTPSKMGKTKNPIFYSQLIPITKVWSAGLKYGQTSVTNPKLLPYITTHWFLTNLTIILAFIQFHDTFNIQGMKSIYFWPLLPSGLCKERGPDTPLLPFILGKWALLSVIQGKWVAPLYKNWLSSLWLRLERGLRPMSMLV